MAPSAPGRFSTTTGCPRVCDIGTAMMRPTTSSAPPAGKVATMRIGFCGYCASAAVAIIATTNPSSARICPPWTRKAYAIPKYNSRSMFDFVTKNRRVVQIILAILTLPFAIWGIESYTRIAGGRDAVAKVNGTEITQRELDEEMARQVDQVRRAFGGQVDPAAFDTPEARRAVLEGLVAQRLVTSEAGKRHLFMSKAAVIE